MNKYKYVYIPSYTSLSPFMSDLALKTHIYEHHVPYETKMLPLLTKEENNLSLEEIMAKYNSNGKIHNFANQVFNHNIFWQSICPNSHNSQAKRKLLSHISLDEIVEHSCSLFGSGWLWCVYEHNTIKIKTSSNAEIPSGSIIFNLDLWEHAFYVDYQSNKKQFVQCFCSYLLNWDYIDQQLEKVM